MITKDRSMSLPQNKALLKWELIGYFSIITLIIGCSFYYFAPCNYAYFNADHAIHVLMAQDFTWPRDYYYWGQNRLGSLLPMVAHYLHYVIPIHYMYVCSIVQYLFLLTGFLVLSKPIKSYLLKIALCMLLFFPVNEYVALILIGHPYSSQLFAGSLFIYFLYLFRKYSITDTAFGWKKFLVALGLCLCTLLFFYAGVWVSEFNAILILIPLFYLIFDKQVRAFFIKGFRNIRVILLELIIIGCCIGIFSFYKHYKGLFYDAEAYTSFIITKFSDIQKNFLFFVEKLQRALLLKDALVLENWFNWFLIILTGSYIFYRVRKPSTIKVENSKLMNALLVVITASCVLLFLSTWNLRSEFSPRYFTPVYIMYGYVLLLFTGQSFMNKYIKWVATVLILFFGIGIAYNTLISKHLNGPMKDLSEYRNLPKGTIIGHYWDVYRVNAVALDSLKSLPFQEETVRNWDWREIALSAKNFYIVRKDPASEPIQDSINQFGFTFKFSGTTYNCNGTEVLLYHKWSKAYAIKALSNNQFWDVDESTQMVYANQPDSTKAEQFELIDLKNGKISFMRSDGKYLYADQNKNANLFAGSENTWDWESFEIVYTDGAVANIKATGGKFLCAEPGNNGVLIANRTQAGEWEKFRLVKVNQ